jgi:excisionase family DNA binding protein
VSDKLWSRESEASGDAIPVPMPVLLRPEDVALLMRIGRTKVYDLMRAGSLRSVQVGRCRRVTPAALAEFVEGLDRSPVA